MQTTAIPFYSNPAVWAVFVSVFAVFLSQMPPIKAWFKKAKLDLEVYSKISITHKVGNPNLQLHLIITNIGGRKVRIKDITVFLSRDKKDLVSLPAQNYLQNQNDPNTLLFTTFSLLPNQEWAHIANFLNFFEREEEKEYQNFHGEMVADYSEKAKNLKDESAGHLIEHPKDLNVKALEFFNSKFVWQSGEYLMKVNVTTTESRANVSKEYRFTMFESHTEQLKEITKEYKLGGGIWWDPKNAKVSIVLPITEA